MKEFNPYDARNGGKRAMVKKVLILTPKKGQPYASPNQEVVIIKGKKP